MLFRTAPCTLLCHYLHRGFMEIAPRAINPRNNSLYNYPRTVYGITQKPMRNFNEVSVPFIFRRHDVSTMSYSFSTSDG